MWENIFGAFANWGKILEFSSYEIRRKIVVSHKQNLGLSKGLLYLSVLFSFGNFSFTHNTNINIVLKWYTFEVVGVIIKAFY